VILVACRRVPRRFDVRTGRARISVTRARRDLEAGRRGRSDAAAHERPAGALTEPGEPVELGAADGVPGVGSVEGGAGGVVVTVTRGGVGAVTVGSGGAGGAGGAGGGGGGGGGATVVVGSGSETVGRESVGSTISPGAWAVSTPASVPASASTAPMTAVLTFLAIVPL
jgi:hypothetical protein